MGFFFNSNFTGREGKRRGGVGTKDRNNFPFHMCFQESRERKVSVKVKIKIPRLPTP